MKKTLFMAFALLAVMLNINAFSQNVGINSDGSIPDNSAMLDLKAANKGLLIPRISLTGVNDATTIPSPATSLLVYNTTTGSGLTTGYYYNSGTPDTPVWKALTTAVGLTNFTESNYLYNTKYGVKLLARNDAQTDVDFVLSPKGNGAILAQQPDGSSAGGNERGQNAVDLQTSRFLNNMVASGNCSVIIGGYGNIASGYASRVMGVSSTASGDYSTAMGSNTHATGDYSTTMGDGTIAPSAFEIAIGRNNIPYTPVSTSNWNSNDKLFVIGNGGSLFDKSNALTILKNANATIGGSLTINGNGTGTSLTLPATRGTSGQVLITDGSGGTGWAAQAGGTVTGVTGTSPIVSTGGNTPVISISPATTTEAGSMSAADKAKLDAQATGTTPGQMQYWNGTAWATIAAGLNGQTLKYKKGVPTWVDGNINDLSIGDSYQGGIIAYFLVAGDPGYDANEKHGLTAAPSDQSTGIQWYNGSNMVTGATDRNLGTGIANTNKIVLSQGPGSYAAQLCADLELGGYSDWYLPSRYELENLELNKMVIGGFADAWYWSSTEFSDNYAERVDFGYHIPPVTIATRDINYHVRAIRSF